MGGVEDQNANRMITLALVLITVGLVVVVRHGLTHGRRGRRWSGLATTH